MNAATSMIEKASESGAAAPTPSAVDAPHLSAGGLLRQAREAQDVRLDTLAAALKVPVQKLEALENDALDLLPDTVFARALAASMCRVLRVDPAPVLAKLPGAPQRSSMAEGDQTLNAGFGGYSARHGGRGGSRLPRLPRRLVVMVGLLLAAALVLHFTPQSTLDSMTGVLRRSPRPATTAGDASATGGPAPAASQAAGGPVVESVAGGAVPMPPPPVLALTATPSLPLASVSGTMPAGTSALVFNARENSWVTVTDASKAVLLKRHLKAGENVDVAGSLPLTVVIGRARAVDVQVLGKPFDLKPVTRSGGNARFVVQP